MSENKLNDPEVFCEKLDEWADLVSNKESSRIGDPKKFREAWQTVRLAISKSCLLSRTIYHNEKPSQTPCPVHKGVWSGIHLGWPNTFWYDIKTGEKSRPIKESPQLREWYDAGCRCFQHSCQCTSGWNPDIHCGCKSET
jgi:hypothetical protein